MSRKTICNDDDVQRAFIEQLKALRDFIGVTESLNWFISDDSHDDLDSMLDLTNMLRAAAYEGTYLDEFTKWMNGEPIKDAIVFTIPLQDFSCDAPSRWLYDHAPALHRRVSK